MEDYFLKIAFVLIILMLIYKCVSSDGFRSDSEKLSLASQIVKNTEPNRDQFRALGLDGVEYYDAKQLWNTPNKFTVKNVAKIL